MGDRPYQYTNHRIAQLDARERAGMPPYGLMEAPTSRHDITEHLAHIRQEMPKLFAAHGIGADHPLSLAHQRLMSAADAWRQSSGGFEADKALHASFMEYNRAIHKAALAARDGNRTDLYRNLTDHMGDVHDVRGDHTRLTMRENPHLPNYNLYPGAGMGPADSFWPINAPELYPNLGRWRGTTPDTPARDGEIRGGWVEPERAWRTGGLQLPIPADLPRFQFAEAGPALANLGRPADRVAPDPEAERTRSTG